MNIETVNNIFLALGLPTSSSVSKLEVGFTNEVYSVDDKYILKVCQDSSNELPFKREAILYKYFSGKLPVPQNVIFDDSKALYSKNFMVYPKIEGENLYNVWHTLTDEQRKELVKQLCSMLKTISGTNLAELPAELALGSMPSWREHVLAKIEKYLKIVGKVAHSPAQKPIKPTIGLSNIVLALINRR